MLPDLLPGPRPPIVGTWYCCACNERLTTARGVLSRDPPGLELEAIDVPVMALHWLISPQCKPADPKDYRAYLRTNAAKAPA